MPSDTLYLVYLDRTETALAAGSDPALRQLDDGLFLVRTEQTRSQLYHAVKRRCRPEKLLVAPLDGDPKFKGMNAGALKWLRATGP